MRTPSHLLVLLMVCTALLTACGPTRPELGVAEPVTATETPVPTATTAPTDTPQPTDTPVPTDTPMPQPTDTPVPAQAESSTDTAFQPIASDECEVLRVAVSELVGIEAIVQETVFTDYINNLSGSGCQILITGTGVDFTNFVDVSVALRELFAGLGWTEATEYLADGPTSTAFAMQSENDLALFSVGWQPSADANCPADQPISACELSPEQQEYFVSIALAQRSE